MPVTASKKILFSYLLVLKCLTLYIRLYKDMLF